MERELGLVMSEAEQERGCLWELKGGPCSEGGTSELQWCGWRGDDALTSLFLRALVLSQHIFSCSHREQGFFGPPTAASPGLAAKMGTQDVLCSPGCRQVEFEAPRTC